jgi:6-phosphogluconolactonase
MKHCRLIGGALVLAFVVFQGCQDSPSSDVAAAPGDGQSIAPDETAGLSASTVEKFGNVGGAVYTLSNGASGNHVLRFTASGGGALMAAGSFETGGLGTGSGLGSQGALLRRGSLLYAVNAGSNSVTVLRENRNGLTRVMTLPSGGSTPISLTVRGDLLSVLNAGGAGNISGFRGAASGRLVPIPGSSKPLSSSAAAPAQIQFSPTRSVLVVTEKGTNRILTYDVGFDGRARDPLVQNSVGETPYGFDFTPKGQLVVSDAFGGTPLQSALSSYKVDRGGVLNLVTGPVADLQTAACWVVISPDGRFAYTTNTGTNNISGFTIGHDGSLRLFKDGGATASSDPGPIDLALSRSSLMLYVLNAGGNSITSYRRDPSRGTLSLLGSVSGLPPGGAGLVAD